MPKFPSIKALPPKHKLHIPIIHHQLHLVMPLISLMGSLKCILFSFLFLIISICSATSDEITTQCGFTRYPTLCVQTLKGLSSRNPNLDFLSTLVNVTISKSNLPVSNFELLSASFVSPEAQRARMAIGTYYVAFFFFLSEKKIILLFN